MQQYDSKLFCGMKLGYINDIVGKLNTFILPPPHPPVDLVDHLGWINTQIPDNLYLDVSYPYRDCDPSQMEVHLTLLDNDDTFSLETMRDFLKTLNLIGYEFILEKLGIEYKEPVFYTEYYVYKK